MNAHGNDAGRRGPGVLEALRLGDPAARVDLTRTDERAFEALREGITMTAREQANTTKRRGRRTLVAGGLALALIGGGTAYATYENWYAGHGGGAGETGGVSCFEKWVDPLSAGPDAASAAATGGPAITGDPVADCQQYQQLSGRPPIKDAVAFTYNETSSYVAPRSEVTADGVLLPPTTGGPEFELRNSLSDLVDGGQSRCFTPAQALAFAKAEVARLGLDDWTVRTLPSWPGANMGSCAWVGIEPNLPDTVSAVNTGEDDPTVPSEGGDPSVYVMRDEFRAQIARKCLSLTEAQAVTVRLLGAEHHWPTGSTEDATMKCTSVDMVVGGSIQIFLRGPATSVGQR